MHTKLSFRKKKFTSNQTRPLLTIPKISSSHTQRFVREHAIDNLFQSVPASLADAAKSQLFAQLNRGRPPSFGSFCHRLSLCSWLLVTGGMASSQVVIALLSWALFCATSQFAIPRDTLDMVMGYGTGRIVVPRDGRR